MRQRLEHSSAQAEGRVGLGFLGLVGAMLSQMLCQRRPSICHHALCGRAHLFDALTQLGEQLDVVSVVRELARCVEHPPDHLVEYDDLLPAHDLLARQQLLLEGHGVRGQRLGRVGALVELDQVLRADLLRRRARILVGLAKGV
eukprot:scaffold63311_cov24-Phaeocystis_antarctica.AAC.1